MNFSNTTHCPLIEKLFLSVMECSARVIILGSPVSQLLLTQTNITQLTIIAPEIYQSWIGTNQTLLFPHEKKVKSSEPKKHLFKVMFFFQ